MDGDRGNLYNNRARPMAPMNDTFGFVFGEPGHNSSTLSDGGNVYENMATPMAPFNDTFGFSFGEPGFNSSTVNDRPSTADERPPTPDGVAYDGAQLQQDMYRPFLCRFCGIQFAMTTEYSHCKNECREATMCPVTDCDQIGRAHV